MYVSMMYVCPSHIGMRLLVHRMHALIKGVIFLIISLPCTCMVHGHSKMTTTARATSEGCSRAAARKRKQRDSANEVKRMKRAEDCESRVAVCVSQLSEGWLPRAFSVIHSTGARHSSALCVLLVIIWHSYEVPIHICMFEKF